VTIERTGAWRAAGTRTTYTADHVVLAAGALGTQRLLHTMAATGRISGMSPMLGVLSRTNSEAILGAVAKGHDVDYSRGVAITSSFHVDERTHVEPVRYGKGSNLMGLLSTWLVAGDGRLPRPARWAATVARHPVRSARSVSVRRWSERSIIALVMQSGDSSLVVRARRRLGRWGITTSYGDGPPNPTWLPQGHEVVRRLADRIGGEPRGSLSEVFDAPVTAHFLGGCVIGDSPLTGVVDPYHRVYGQPGLHVVDGAAVTANLGVNPSLTITAQAERALALWPNAGERDHRAPLGEPYVRIDPVPPRAPVVPPHAYAALRAATARTPDEESGCYCTPRRGACLSQPAIEPSVFRLAAGCPERSACGMTRTDTPASWDERTILTTMLDYARATVHAKCEGVTEDDARAAPLTDVAAHDDRRARQPPALGRVLLDPGRVPG
jgi:cholesterol oxidase